MLIFTVNHVLIALTVSKTKPFVLIQTNISKSMEIKTDAFYDMMGVDHFHIIGGARWLSGRVSDSGARGPGLETYRRRVVSLSKTLYSPRVLVNYPGSDGSVPT